MIRRYRHRINETTGTLRIFEIFVIEDGCTIVNLAQKDVKSAVDDVKYVSGSPPYQPKCTRSSVVGMKYELNFVFLNFHEEEKQGKLLSCTF